MNKIENLKQEQNIEWKKIDISDRDVFEKYGENKEGIAMFSFASLFFWRGYYETSYMEKDGIIIASGLSDERTRVVYFPRGLNENAEKVLNFIVENVSENICFMPLTKSDAELIEGIFPNAKVFLLEGKCEYVYNRDDLAYLAGKKYHSKRNHIAKFDKNYEYEYINITEENVTILSECAEYMYNLIENSPMDEYEAIKSAIEHFSTLDMRACVLKSDGRFVGYSIGSSINGEYADIHFEKADRSFEGSYAKVNNCFAKYGFADKKYLNREEDLGIEGLRKAKLSYYPCKLNQMYKVELF